MGREALSEFEHRRTDRQRVHVDQHRRPRPRALRSVDVGRANAVGGPDLDLAHLLKPLKERSEEHTSELQSLMRISYAVFCLKKKKQAKHKTKKIKRYEELYYHTNHIK